MGAKYENSIFSLSDFGVVVNPNETGATFFENANIKSVVSFNELKEKKLLKVDDYIIADDTGLLIDFLDGKPGIYSARFMGDISQKEKNEKIINLMENCKNSERTARFETHLSVIEINNDKNIINMPKPLHFVGIMNGFIAKKLVGNSGFGYDPIFAVCDYRDLDKDEVLTYASIGQDKKNAISHRAKALKLFVSYLEKK